MQIIEQIKQKIATKAEKAVVVFAEGWNTKIQSAVIKLAKENLIKPLIIFRTISEADEFNKLDAIASQIARLIVETTDLSEYSNYLYELRKAKGLSLDEAKELVKQPNYLCALLTKINPNFGSICGIEYTTKDTLKAALQVIKAKKDVKTISSAMILEKDSTSLFMADVGLIINPNAEELAAIAYNTANFVTHDLGLKNNHMAFLSYSTKGSGAGESVDKVKAALEIYLTQYEKNQDVKADGEMQFDSAFDPQTRKKKAPNNDWTDNANILLVPNLDTGNISYKMLQKLGGFNVTGPFILGLDKPMNDLSRGAGEYEIISLAYLTALQIK